ncbi:MAG TPA: winged helix-turn-helix domain-containing protein [Terriglobales bacterium]|nr:winged helix-turn-helix domain-containing protein [Terriglobales bacterium]
MSRRIESAVPELDLLRFELRINGSPVPLEKIPLELLILLVENRGQLVSREAIIERLWGKDVYLDTEQGINTAIRKIRRAFCDEPENPRFVQTVVGKGYRFVGPITVIGRENENSTPVPSTSTGLALSFRSIPGWLFPSIGVGLILVSLLILPAMVKPGGRERSSVPEIRSIAVLPFENLSGDSEKDYLAEGMTDALLSDLAQIHSLRVISRTSSMHYRGSMKSLPEIAKELNVDAVVEGTLACSGNRARVTAQLIQASTDKHLWADSYERNLEDLIAFQAKVALNIASEISATLSSQEQLRIARNPLIKPEARDAYLRGRYLLNLRDRDNLLRAPYYFRLATEKDPTFAEAYAGLSEAYSACAGWDVLREEGIDEKIEAAAVMAVKLDDNSSAAHTALASYMCTRKDRQGIEREIKRALELNPNNSTAHKLYALYLHLVGKLDSAIEEATRAQDLDPLAAHLSITLGHLFYDARQFDRAIAQFRRAIELDPQLQFLHLNIGWAYARNGMHRQAVREWKAYWDRSPKLSRIVNKAYERSGYQGYLRSLLQENFAHAFSPLRFSSYQRAVILTELGDKNRAFDALATAIQEHDDDLDELQVDSDLDALRADVRFPELVSRCRKENGTSRPF